MTGIRKRRWPCEDTEMDTGSMPREDGGRDQGDTAEAGDVADCQQTPRRGETSKRFLPHSARKELTMKVP